MKELGTDDDKYVDIPTSTKYVLSLQRKTSHSWSIWTKEARRSPKMRYTTTSSMARTKSRSENISPCTYHVASSLTDDLFADYIREEVDVLYLDDFSLSTHLATYTRVLYSVVCMVSNCYQRRILTRQTWWNFQALQSRLEKP